MKTFILITLLFLSFSFKSHADFKPLEKEVLTLKEKLSTIKSIQKDELEASLDSIKEKAALIVNDIARTDLTGDVDILLKKYVYKNEDSFVESKELDYWLDHIVDDLAMFIKMGITE